MFLPKGAIANPVCECGRTKDFRRKGQGIETYLTCRRCFNEKQYRRIRERKTKICEIHGEAKILQASGWWRCPECNREQAKKSAATERSVRADDPLNGVQGPVRLPEVFPSDSMWLRALALRIDGCRGRRGNRNWKRSDARESSRQEEVRA